MTKVCTHGRDATVAMRQLHQSLKRLRTDYLDLWQVHECVSYSDPDMHFARGGVIEALDRAKREGKVRYVGFTGHKSPDIHLQMLSHGYPFDSCQLPLNCFDASFESFEQRVLPELHRQQIAALGMKSLGGEGDAVKKRAVRVEDALRYAMSLPVATTISGIDSTRVLSQNVRIASGSSHCPAHRCSGSATAWRPWPPTAASSCIRRRRSMKGTWAASSTGSRRQRRWEARDGLLGSDLDFLVFQPKSRKSRCDPQARSGWTVQLWRASCWRRSGE